MDGKTNLIKWVNCTAILLALLVSGIAMAQAFPGAYAQPASAYTDNTIQGTGLAHQNSISLGGVPGQGYNPDAVRCFWLCGRGGCVWTCRSR